MASVYRIVVECSDINATVGPDYLLVPKAASADASTHWRIHISDFAASFGGQSYQCQYPVALGGGSWLTGGVAGSSVGIVGVGTEDVAALTSSVLLVWAVAWLCKRAVRILIPNA